MTTTLLQAHYPLFLVHSDCDPHFKQPRCLSCQYSYAQAQQEREPKLS